MDNKLRIKGRTTAIIDPDTELSVMLNASYQGREYELFKVTVAAKQSPSSDEAFALSCPDTKYESDLVNVILSSYPDTALMLHFRPEDRKEIPGGLNGIILIAEVGKRKYFGMEVLGYEGDKGVPRLGHMINADAVEIEDSADVAISGIPNQLKR